MAVSIMESRLWFCIFVFCMYYIYMAGIEGFLCLPVHQTPLSYMKYGQKSSLISLNPPMLLNVKGKYCAWHTRDRRLFQTTPKMSTEYLCKNFLSGWRGVAFDQRAGQALIGSCVWRIWSGQYGNCYLVSGRPVVNHWDCITGSHRYLGPVFYRFIPHHHNQYNLLSNSLQLHTLALEVGGMHLQWEGGAMHISRSCGWINIIAGGRGGRPLHTSGPLLLNQDLLLSRCVVKD